MSSVSHGANARPLLRKSTKLIGILIYFYYFKQIHYYQSDLHVGILNQLTLDLKKRSASSGETIKIKLYFIDIYCWL
jgi:hypothetical protein